MNKILGTGVVLGLALFVSATSVKADAVTDLVGQVQSMQKQMANMQKEIQILRKQKLQTPKSDQDLVVRVDALEKRESGGMLSLRGENWQLGGELELEYIDTQADTDISEPEPRFNLDKFVLEPVIHFTDNITWETEIEFNRDGAKIDATTLEISDLPFNSEIVIGLTKRFIAPASRKTEVYPLAGNAFWRDEEIGVHLSSTYGPITGHLSISDGLDISTRGVTEDSSFSILHDDARKAGFGGIKEIGLGLELDHDLKDFGDVNVLGFWLFDELSGGDIAALQSALPGYTSNGDNRHRVGINLNYQLGAFNFFSQYIHGKDGSLDRQAWYIQPSYKLTLPFDINMFKTHELLLRYGRYDIDIDKSFGSPATWDREALTIAVASNIRKNMRLLTSYTVNDEETGNRSVKNGELVVQLETKF